MFDTLAFGMGFGELLGGAFDVGTHVLELRGNLLLQGELLDVDRVVRIRGHSRVGVLLPGVGFRPADDDLDTVVLDGAGEGLTQTTLGDEGLDGILYLRTERFEGLFAGLSFNIMCKSFVLGFDLTNGHSTLTSSNQNFRGLRGTPRGGKIDAF